MLATVVPVVVLFATRVSGAGVAEAQVAFILSGGTALIVDRVHLAVVRHTPWKPGRPRSAPVRAAGLAAAGCAVVTALLLPWSSGYVARAAEGAALASGLLAVGLLAPALPDASGRARDVVWRLLMVATAGAALAMLSLGLALAGAAVAWWLASWVTHGVAKTNRGPTAAQVADPVTVVSETSTDPGFERRRLLEHRFGVVTRGGEHRLVDAASPRVAALPHDRRVDWWRVSETVPVVNGAVPFTLIRPALDHHPRVLVQIGDDVVGVLDGGRARLHRKEPVSGR